MYVIIHEPGSGKFMVIKGRLVFIHIRPKAQKMSYSKWTAPKINKRLKIPEIDMWASWAEINMTYVCNKDNTHRNQFFFCFLLDMSY